ncbi:BQ5605_C019g08856 [Microbotryum silenes-dioicae]|uniref:BQ5605_C019g08856 protein n=1 Tax=Microbotryum silenes-dioicae TaxID=796604 RepID=A0A2X0LZX9_9BASI|nr:BQ5605_C019g08856 [Microbotryum silenes-dioicae]
MLAHLSRATRKLPIVSFFHSHLSLPRTIASMAAPPIKGKSFRIALIQLGGVGPDKTANLERARVKISEAVKGGKEGRKPDMIVLPEIFNSPYATGSFRQYAERIAFDPSKPSSEQAETSLSESLSMLSQAAKDANAWLVGGSIPELAEDLRIYNSSPTFSPDGTLVALHRKVHLFDIDIPGGITFKESETLTGGDHVTIVQTGGQRFGKIAIGICYDLRFPELAMHAARQGCVAMIYPAAFNCTTGPLHWDLLQRARAVDNQFYIVMCSPARATDGDGYKAWGYSGVTDPMQVPSLLVIDVSLTNFSLRRGKIVAQMEEKEGILFADIDMDVINKARAGIPVTVQRRFDVYSDVTLRKQDS